MQASRPEQITKLGFTLKGTTVSVTLNGSQVLGHVFNSLLVDGEFGIVTTGTGSFDEVSVSTDDPAFQSDNENNSPVAADDTGTTDEESGLTIDVLANDSDPDPGDSLTITAVTQGNQGGHVSIAGGLVAYDPSGAFDYLAVGDTTTDSFGYTISDGNGGFAIGTVVVTVTGVNDVPIAVADLATTTEDASLVIDVLANDSDPDTNDTIGITEVTQGANGGLVSLVNGSITYDPNGQFDYLVLGISATDTFTYTIDDGHDSAVNATVHRDHQWE